MEEKILINHCLSITNHKKPRVFKLLIVVAIEHHLFFGYRVWCQTNKQLSFKAYPLRVKIIMLHFSHILPNRTCISNNKTIYCIASHNMYFGLSAIFPRQTDHMKILYQNATLSFTIFVFRNCFKFQCGKIKTSRVNAKRNVR